MYVLIYVNIGYEAMGVTNVGISKQRRNDPPKLRPEDGLIPQLDTHGPVVWKKLVQPWPSRNRNDLPIEDGDFLSFFVCLPEGNSHWYHHIPQFSWWNLH